MEHKNKFFPSWIDILSIIGVFVLSQVLITLFLEMVLDYNDSFMFFLSYTLSFTITIVYALSLNAIKYKSKQKLPDLKYHKIQPILLLFGVIMCLALSIVVEPLLELLPAKYLELVYEYLNKGGWAVFSAVIIAPIVEELLFRGIIQKGLSASHSPFYAIMVSSAIFALVHINPIQVIAVFFISILIGYIYYRTNSLLTVIIIHMINNALSYSLFVVFGNQTLRTVIKSNTLYYSVYVVSVLLAIVLIIKIIMLLKDKKTGIQIPSE